jgi:succinyl-CoA synthetase beta subunit
MDLTDAADAIREKLIEHRLSPKASLWSTILEQIRKQNSFDGHYVEPILEIIR